MKTISVVIFTLFVISSCEFAERSVKPKEPPSVLTELFDVTTNSATVGLVLEYDGSAGGLDRGICWSTTPNPTIDNHVVNSMSHGDGAHYYTELTNLEENTTIYFRAFAQNVLGLSYGNELSFTTGNFNVTIPCQPTKNTFVFNLSTDKMTDVQVTYWSSFGDYSITGTTNTGYKMAVDFSKAPVSGIYTTTSNAEGIDNKCTVTIHIGGTANWLFKADSDDKVYVKKTGENKYSVTFCNLHFKSNTTNIEFDTDGNISVD